MKYLRFSILFILGCGGVVEQDVGWRPLEGDPYVTPKYGLTFYWVGPGGKYQTPEETASAIDAIVIEWHQIYEARWGFSLSRDQRVAAIRRVDIQLFQSWKIRGNGHPGHTYGIWWPWQHQIDVAMATPAHLDTGLNVWSEGLQVLRHEWSHVLQGAYHP